MQEPDIFQAIRHHRTADPVPHVNALRAQLAGETDKRFWRTVEEFADTPAFQEFLEGEFPRWAGVYEHSVSRRGFLKLAGAALAMAGLAACAPAQGEKLVPYVRQPERVVPGESLFYTTAHVLGGYASGLLVRSYMGRPLKIEGNPSHPASLGATDSFAQASILTLYDPDRSQAVMQASVASSWENFVTALRAGLDAQRANGGAGLRILSQTVSSPTLGAQFQTLLDTFPNARWHQYEPFGRENAWAGAELALGRAVETRYDLTRADVILALDGDFLDCGPGNLRYARDFASRRKPDAGATMNRLYAVESTPGLTGSQADHRLPLRASQIAPFISAVAAALGIAGANNAAPSNIPPNWIPALGRDLQAHQGTSVVIAGDSMPAYVHAAAHAINGVLGNVGTTVTYSDPITVRPVDEPGSLRDLVNDLDAGRVQMLLIFGGNPVYDAPVDFQFAERLARVPFSAHLNMYQDETSARTTWHIPEAHYLETWGDARAFDGTATIQQPLIAPLYAGKSALELVSVMLEPTPRSGDQIVKAYWQQAMGADFDEMWQSSLSQGFVPDSAFPDVSVTTSTDFIGDAPAEFPLQSVEVAFRPDPTVHDGRFANNAWLQELPKPFSKITWDNIVAISPATAERMGFTSEVALTGGERGQVWNNLGQLEYQGRALRAPVWIMPGHPDDMVTLFGGYGRTRVPVSENIMGYNAFALRPSNALWSGAGLELTRLDERYPLATTQFHQTLDGRDLIRAATLEEFTQHPDFAHTEHPDVSLYPPQNHDGEQWGMVIDLNACIACEACVVACQSENNIPTVGKAEVMRAREMHWLRIDQYHEGDPSNPQTFNQPVPCMHCEYAPCEPVCPTTATTHSHDGLNEMTYNRCIGTRYCSNNCPYKVRRFNFFQYEDWSTPSLKPLRNPDVTVRSRGVMEKCTYCVQRIERGRIEAATEGRPLRDGDIVTACQAACPTEAIIFGNINDPNSRVAQLKASPRNYGMLEHLNTRPRTTYLAAVRNPNPEI